MLVAPNWFVNLSMECTSPSELQAGPSLGKTGHVIVVPPHHHWGWLVRVKALWSKDTWMEVLLGLLIYSHSKAADDLQPATGPW